MTYDQAMERYGNDKPDIRFGMEFGQLNDCAQHAVILAFLTLLNWLWELPFPGNAYSRKEIDQLIEWVKRPQIGAAGMVYCRVQEDGSYKSSVDKFFTQRRLGQMGRNHRGSVRRLDLCALRAPKIRCQKLSALRMELAERLGLRKPDEFAPLWVVDFPLLEWDEETERFHAMHHPFTSPKPGQMTLLETNPAAVKANAYDLVLNGNEIGGGSIRIHDKATQSKMFDYLGFTPEEAKVQFGFLMDAFQYGAPPHGGIAFGLDRLVAILGGSRDNP